MTKTVQGCEMLAKFESKHKSKHKPSQSWDKEAIQADVHKN